MISAAVSCLLNTPVRDPRDLVLLIYCILAATLGREMTGQGAVQVVLGQHGEVSVNRGHQQKGKGQNPSQHGGT